MPTMIQPFKALRYNADKVSTDKVICPPYDVLNETLADKLMNQSPYNSIFISYNVDKQTGQNKYKHVPERIKEWKEKEILIEDKKYSFYILEENFEHEGQSKTRLGVFALIPVSQNKNIIPHEKIFTDAVTDRLHLLETTKTHISPIFLVSEDPAQQLTNWLQKQKSNTDVIAYEYPNDYIDYKLGAVTNEKEIKNLQTILENQLLLIADGHHRFATAKAYSRKENKEKYILALIAPSNGVIFSYDKILTEILETTEVTTAKIIESCKTGKLLPQKTTYFYPKVMTGFVFSKLN